MPATRQASQILAVEIIGFLVIIALSWANELFGLPSLIFGSGHRANWPESVLETVTIALVAIPVLVLTRRLVLRLHYLEEFMRVCAWCRKLSVGNEWIPLEEFFERKFRYPDLPCDVSDVPGRAEREATARELNRIRVKSPAPARA